jgi:CubicO group peptidase (beta-lactamase class C family)
MARAWIRLTGVVLALAVAGAAAGTALTSIVYGQAPASARPVWAAEIDRIFASWDHPDTPGCAVGIFKDGRLVYDRGFGSADLEHGIPITADTMFYAGSIAKQFTAMAAALAIQRGFMRLEDDVRTFVPELPSYGAPITIRHLLHHMSGLRDINALMSIAGRRDDDAFDNETVLRVVARQRSLDFKPGDEYSYSNSGYALLALATERASKTSFASFADAKVFKPLGMSATHYHTDLGRLVNNRAFAYDWSPSAPGDVRLNIAHNQRAGAGGLLTSVRELLSWDENFYTGQVGGRDVIVQLETPGRLNDGTALDYGWGLRVGAYRGLPIVEHNGALGGFRAQIIRFRAQHTTAALLCNAASIDATDLSRRMMDVYLRDTFTQPKPAAVKPLPDAAVRTPEAPVAYSAAELAGLTGSYVSDELETTYHVGMVGAEGLWLTRATQPARMPLQPGARDEFRAGSLVLRFERDATGRATGLLVDSGRIRGLRFVREAK